MPELILALSIAAIIIGILLLYFIPSIYVMLKIMHPKKRDFDTLLAYEVAEKNYDPKWLDILFEEKRITSTFGYELYARLYKNPTPTNKFMIALHGHNSSGMGMLKYLDIFLDAGYNVFIPDHRYSGNSGGGSITFGHYEKHDTVSWIDLLQKEYPNAIFAIFGESMGAATGMLVTATDKRINFLIEYCGYANFKELSTSHIKPPLLYNIFELGFKIVARILFKVKFKETDAAKAMAQISVPVLIMHSEADLTTGINNAHMLAKVNPSAKVLYFKDTHHARSLMKYPELFTQTVKDFIIESEKKMNIA
ncbi:MAG: alpha/beta fold hydrolase [Clostridia bacterium]